MSRFELAFRWVLYAEGGHVIHPADPGGETCMGISRRAFPGEDIAGLTVERARELYHSHYWTPCRCDELPPGLDLALFDTAVHSGVRQAVRLLQRGLGVKVDGQLGEKTLAAARQRGAPATLLADRMTFLAGLETWKTFGRGWSRRVIELAQVIERGGVL